jgi:hypothetical protein
MGDLLLAEGEREKAAEQYHLKEGGDRKHFNTTPAPSISSANWRPSLVRLWLRSSLLFKASKILIFDVCGASITRESGKSLTRRPASNPF